MIIYIRKKNNINEESQKKRRQRNERTTTKLIKERCESDRLRSRFSENDIWMCYWWTMSDNNGVNKRKMVLIVAQRQRNQGTAFPSYEYAILATLVTKDSKSLSASRSIVLSLQIVYIDRDRTTRRPKNLSGCKLGSLLRDSVHHEWMNEWNRSKS